MNIEGIYDRDGYVEARLAGPFQIGKLEAIFGSIIQTVTEKESTRLLMNTLAMTGPGPTFLERYQLAMIMAQLPKGIRLANLARAEWIDPERFGLRVAQNRGADAEIFSDLDQALAWLLGKSEKASEPPPPPTAH